MCAANPVCILWDASHIWGLMVWRALCALGLPCRLVKGQDIANGALFRKPCPQGTPDKAQGAAPLLLVPGGNARLKARALGEKGRQAVRDYLAEGGRYLGFCGGAGLALSQHRSQDGLGLCPWGRAPYPERLHHLISGHAHMRVRSCMARDLPAVRPDFPKACPDGAAPDPLRPPLGDEACALVPPHWRGCAHGHDDDCRHCSNCRPPREDGHVPSLPVWWPGRFAPEADERVSILASYRQPDTDFWLADLPLSLIPAPVFEAWKDLYGVNVSADFLDGQPLMVAGNYDTLSDLSRRFDVPFHLVSHEGISREEQEERMLRLLDDVNADYIVLAKYMRILSPQMVAHFPLGKLINIHHSFLPAFIGARPYQQAYDRGVKIIGATAHFVTDNLDEGPIIEQDVIKVNHRYTAETMAKAGRDVERLVLMRALTKVLDDKVFIHGNKTVVF